MSSDDPANAIKKRGEPEHFMPRGLRDATFIAALIAVPAFAWGQDLPAIPSFDVKAACFQIGPSEIEAACMKDGLAARERLKSMWPNATTSARNIAIRAAEVAVKRRSYYQVLNARLRDAMLDEEIARERPAAYPVSPLE